MAHNPVAWPRLAEIHSEHGAQIALLQEAVPPPDGEWRTHPSVSDLEQWRTYAHAGVHRRFVSAVVALDPELRLTPVRPQPLAQAEYGEFAVSQPGQFAVAEVGLPGGMVTVVSMYGIWDRDKRSLFAEATLHRAISDLTMLLQEQHRTVILAGHLNIYRNWDQATHGADWAPRYNTVFDRLAAYGLELAGPVGAAPLEGCPCQRPGCDHVRTYAHHSKPANVPYQLDYVFCSPTLRGTAEVRVLDDEAAWQYSDHLPVLSTFTLPA